MNKTELLNALNCEKARLLEKGTKQRISEAKNLANFTNAIKNSTIETIELDKNNSLNIGYVAIGLLENIVVNNKHIKSDFHGEKIMKLKSGYYQMASCVKSRAATPKPSKNYDLKGFIYLIYTSTVKGIYKIDIDKVLGINKVSVGYIVENGKMLKALA